jgi:hypothetical protein
MEREGSEVSEVEPENVKCQKMKVHLFELADHRIRFLSSTNCLPICCDTTLIPHRPDAPEPVDRSNGETKGT